MSKPTKAALEAQLLQAKIRHELAQAELAEIDLAVKMDAERDRQVKTGRIRHLFINDTIIGSNADKWLDALQHWERRDPGLPITIDINSPGGSVTDGFAIYDQIERMRRKGAHVTTRGVGMVASMAAVLLQAGDVRVMDARAKMLIHEGSQNYGGQSLTVGEQEDLRAFREMLLGDILDILAARSTLSRRALANKWKRKDWWLSANEALKLGLCDVVE